MKSAVICAVLLALFHGSVFAGIRSQGKRQTANVDAKIFPMPGKPAVSIRAQSERIGNGTNATIADFPYIVRVQVETEIDAYSCGGSIITFWHAFTAAHCVDELDAESITLYGGSALQSAGAVQFNVSKVVIHPGYNSKKPVDNDAAIIKVSNTFQGYTNIVPIALQDAEVPAGTLCSMAGWGLVSSEIGYPDNLQYTILKAMSPKQCANYYSNRQSVICAEKGDGGYTCGGDSGGPLVCLGKLTGALSLGPLDCADDYPSAFAKVMAPAIRKFIRRHAGI